VVLVSLVNLRVDLAELLKDFTEGQTNFVVNLSMLNKFSEGKGNIARIFV
jgi:hypothetical protein